MKIQYSFDEAIFGSAYDMDVEASGEKLEAVILAAITDQFPDAAIDVTYTHNVAGGGKTTVVYADGDAIAEEKIASQVREIVETVFENGELWCVSSSSSDNDETMENVTISIDQYASLEAHTTLTSDFSFEDTRAVRVKLSKKGNRFSYDIEGANDIALGNWSGMEWDEVCAWAGLAHGIEQGDVVFDRKTGNLYLAYEWDDDAQYVFVGFSNGDAQEQGWADENDQPLEGITAGEYYLPYDNAMGYRDAFWQKNQEVNSPCYLSDYEYNGGHFQLRNS